MRAFLEGENPDTIREGVHVALGDCEEVFKAQEVNRRMKDKAAHACRALCRARILEEIKHRKGTATSEHLRVVLSVIDGPPLANSQAVRPYNRRGIVMTSTAEEKAFLKVAVAAIPRTVELIWGFSPDDRAGALEKAERCFLAAALDYGRFPPV